jgi:hypothetical protein
MTPFGIWLCLSQEKVQPPTIGLFQDSFIVRYNGKRAEVPLQLPRPRPPLNVSFRKNQNFAVWDDRGLTIRIGKQVKSLRMEEFAVSPRIFTKEEIQETVAKKRSRKAAALSGARRIGTTAFFLVRWEDKGQTWLETLVSIDLAEPTFHPSLLARLPGTSLADEPIDDRLILLGNRISVLVKKGKDWGLDTYDSQTKKFEFDSLGQGLESYLPVTNRLGAFVEKTAYASRIAGRVDLATLVRKNLFETKGSVRFVDATEPLVAVIHHGDDIKLRNADTGAEAVLPASSSMRRTPLGIVVWSPYKMPKRAWLYEPARWSPIAQWTNGEG